MNGFQIASISLVCFFMPADHFSIEMYSISRFFQIVILLLCRDFQFMRIVFFAMIMAMDRILLDVMLMFTLEMSPSKQRDGGRGMWQSGKRERLSVMLCVHSHVACMQVSVVLREQ